MIKKIGLSAFLLTAVLAVTFKVLVITPVTTETTSSVENNLQLQMALKSTTIKIGEEINITLTLRNVGTSNVTIAFTTSQRFDVMLCNGTISYSWSDDKYFLMVVGEVSLEPREEFSQTLQWNFYRYNHTSGEYVPPSPGDYYLIGVCVGNPGIITSLPITLVTKNPLEGRAVIFEMNEFPEGWTDLPVDFINSERMRDVLLELGWKDDNILVIHDNLTITTVKTAVDWLANVTNANDIALLYIFTHGMWMRNVLLWNEWFPDWWAKVNTSRRILMIDTCFAGEFIGPIYNDPEPHISLVGCSADEIAWAGTEEEGLPIIGSVWNYYFTNALGNLTADSDGSGFVSAEEAFNFSTLLVQEYMDEIVFTVPEFLGMYHDIGIYPENYDAYPHPVMDDQYPEQLCLDLEYYRLIGDLNDDGIVDIYDVVTVAIAFGSKPGDRNWNPAADLKNDSIIDIFDVVIVAKNFSKA